MQREDTPHGYGPSALAIHWLAAAAVIAIWLLGNRLDDLPRGPERSEALHLHISVAIVLLAILIGRIAWRVLARQPERPQEPPLLKAVAGFVQWGLILALAVLVISGPLTVWSLGRPIPVFGLFAIPSPMGESHGLHEAMETIHVFATKAIFVLFLLHVLGALRLWVSRQSGLRMLQPGR